ncbi:hypothetical protein M9H77_22781 [Catharanthus roseus]|uniref:Uncharacterized protein n=1 Tax=Catharanthus roseus TaxID=4058 RepID=A0ACC0AVH7_CATRO|nr:hypothetical protein M9H77_22781 [Catharanthus roseus]
MDESIVDVESSFYSVVFVRGEVIVFNVEKLSAFLEIPTYPDVLGTGLKDDIDLDMVTAELARGAKTTWLGEGKLSSTCLTLKYFGLYKISCTNWIPSTNVSVVLRDRAIMLYLLGTYKPVNMGQLREKIVNRKQDAEAKEGTMMKAKKPFTTASKQKSAQATIAPSTTICSSELIMANQNGSVWFEVQIRPNTTFGEASVRNASIKLLSSKVVNISNELLLLTGYQQKKKPQPNRQMRKKNKDRKKRNRKPILLQRCLRLR